MNDWKKQYKGNYMIFNSRNINKPQILELILIPSTDYCFVCNLTEGDPDEILKWGLKPKQLHKQALQLKRVYNTNYRGPTLIRVTYKGKIKNKDNMREDKFIIEQKMTKEWYPISYDLRYLSKARGNYQIAIPNHIRSRGVSGGKTVETAIKLRDFYESACFSNVPELKNGRKKAPHGVIKKLTDYVESHDVLKQEEIQELYNSAGTYFDKYYVPMEDWEEYQRFKRWKELDGKN